MKYIATGFGAGVLGMSIHYIVRLFNIKLSKYFLVFSECLIISTLIWYLFQSITDINLFIELFAWQGSFIYLLLTRYKKDIERSIIYLAITKSKLRLVMITGVRDIKKKKIEYFYSKIKEIVKLTEESTGSISSNGNCFVICHEDHIDFRIIFVNNGLVDSFLNSVELDNINIKVETKGLGIFIDYKILNNCDTVKH